MPFVPTFMNVGLRCAALTFLLTLALAAPATAATGPTILVKFKQPANGAARVAASGDGFVRETAGKVAVVDPGPGESVADAVAAYRREARRRLRGAESRSVTSLRSEHRTTPTTRSSGRCPRSTPSAAGRSSRARSRPRPAFRSESSTPASTARTPTSRAGSRPTAPSASAAAARPARRPTRSATELTWRASPEPPPTTRSASPGSTSASPLIAVRVFHDDPTTAGSLTTPTSRTESPGRRSTAPG